MQVYELLARMFFGFIALCLVVLASGLIVFAGMELVNAFEAPEYDVGRSLLDSVGYMVIAIAVFEVAKYILEEEALVAIFQASKGDDLSQMLYPTILLFGAVALIVGLGLYQRLSASAERDVRASPEAAAEERAELEKH